MKRLKAIESKRYRFNLHNLFNSFLLGLNAAVVVDSVAVPGPATAVNDPFKFVRICNVSDNVFEETILITQLYLFLKLLITSLAYHF